MLTRLEEIRHEITGERLSLIEFARKFGLKLISIAALIIALGMLVDDPVVAADGINRGLSNGQPREIAAWLGPHQLRRPIFFATLINILAFLPLVLLPGDKKFFIYALPVVVTLA